MIYIVLLFIGIILVIISFIYILKIEKEKDEKYNYIEEMYLEIKKYNNKSMEIMEEFEELVDLSISNIENTLEDKNKEKQSISNKKNNLFESKNYLTEKSQIDKILELKKIGLTNEEIAKKLNKGIREIDIILKVNTNNTKI
ncbi:DUF6115 domain-containing protein [Anaerosalibacter massiliensis]|uniref:Uncharacterized protein n=1 Tax=Anaerosalibacter massiliensis TaxID=1347392 RepID=A0A9X2MD17_9FIRM|nr:hypothetical protein [Anaerosalibacter massiliensis]MCR2042742.1 hypothetical protein [Anaerosalibacter massiliensis]